jgi:hypothetical protein
MPITVGGRTIFPGRDEIEERPETIYVKDPPTPQASVPEYIEPVILGCVDYSFEFKSEHHQTAFIFDLMKRAPVAPITSNEKAVIPTSAFDVDFLDVGGLLLSVRRNILEMGKPALRSGLYLVSRGEWAD